MHHTRSFKSTLRFVPGCFITICLLLFTGSIKAQTLRVLSYNIHHGADRNENNTLDSMGYFIKSMQPDLVALQEVDSVCTRSGKIDQMKRLAEITGMHYAFVRHFAYQGGAYGLGILSKKPIVTVENKRLKLLKKGANSNEVAMLFASVTLRGEKKLLFATAHFDATDSNTRQSQVTETLDYLSANTLPVIFTGDLNATPDAPEIQRLQQVLQTTDSAGLLTFPERNATKKIDYILVSPRHLKRVKKVAVPQVYHSDHLPVMAEIRLK